MKVSLCEKCKHYERRTWSKAYKPNGYHAIGITRAYAYCTLNDMRCSNVKNHCLNWKGCDGTDG